MLRSRFFLAGLFAIAGISSIDAADLTASLKKGTAELKSVGPMAFGPEGILFVGDPQSATVFALGTGDTKPDGKGALKVEKIDEKIGSLLGTSGDQILINDMKVNPASGNLYISVSRGKGPDGTPVIVKLDRSDKLTELGLKDIPFASVSLPAANTNRNKRSNAIESITGIAYTDGQVIVAGLSTEQFASRLRAIQFPFKEADKGAPIEIYHGAHGGYETQAPVRTFLPFDIGGETNIVASYTCTPLVKIPVKQLKPGDKVRGTTVAELGNRNVPIDIISYKKDGKTYLLMCNTARGVMKVDTSGIDKAEPITSRISNTAGLKYDTIQELKDIVQLDKLDDDRAVLLKKSGKNLDLDTIPLP